MTEKKIETKDDLLKRLRRIEGQVKGIQKMIEADKSCNDILTQVSAVRAAINRVGGIILEKHSISCIQSAVMSEDKDKAISNLAKTMQTFMKFTD